MKTIPGHGLLPEIIQHKKAEVFMFVRVVDYAPEWEKAFSSEAQCIRDILGNELITLLSG